MQPNLNHKNTRRKRKGARERKPVSKNKDIKFPNLEREKNYVSSGSTVGPKQDEPKETNSKTHQH